MKTNTYQIYFTHPDIGEVVVCIIRGKSEALKRLHQLAKERPDHLFYLKEYQI